jgi:hypothetical protein
VVQTIHVSLSRDRLGFTLPAGTWHWRAQAANLGNDPGAVMAGQAVNGGHKLEIGIRAIPSATFPSTGCMAVAERLMGSVYRPQPWWAVGFSQYHGKRGENSVLVCLVRRGTYYAVSINGPLKEYEVQSELRRVLDAFSAAAN